VNFVAFLFDLVFSAIISQDAKRPSFQNALLRAQCAVASTRS